MSTTQTQVDINQALSTGIAVLPGVIAGIQAAEQTGAAGATKKDIVVNGVIAGAKAVEGSNVPTVSAVGAIVDVCVSIFNAMGWL